MEEGERERESRNYGKNEQKDIKKRQKNNEAKGGRREERLKNLLSMNHNDKKRTHHAGTNSATIGRRTAPTEVNLLDLISFVCRTKGKTTSLLLPFCSRDKIAPSAIFVLISPFSGYFLTIVCGQNCVD